MRSQQGGGRRGRRKENDEVRGDSDRRAGGAGREAAVPPVGREEEGGGRDAARPSDPPRGYLATLPDTVGREGLARGYDAVVRERRARAAARDVARLPELEPWRGGYEDPLPREIAVLPIVLGGLSAMERETPSEEGQFPMPPPWTGGHRKPLAREAIMGPIVLGGFLQGEAGVCGKTEGGGVVEGEDSGAVRRRSDGSSSVVAKALSVMTPVGGVERTSGAISKAREERDTPSEAGAARGGAKCKSGGGSGTAEGAERRSGSDAGNEASADENSASSREAVVGVLMGRSDSEASTGSGEYSSPDNDFDYYDDAWDEPHKHSHDD